LNNIVHVEATPHFLVSGVHRALYLNEISTHDVVTFILAAYSPERSTQSAPLPQIAMDQLRAVHHTVRGWDLADPILLVTAENAANMASGQALTCRSCLKGLHCADWIDVEFTQLDKHYSYDMYGPPLSCSAVPPFANVVRPIWKYLHKGYGTVKAHKFMNCEQLVCMGLTFDNI
jgi:hypothetical protein